MPQHDSDEELIAALRDMRPPPAPPLDAMWDAIAPHVGRSRGRWSVWGWPAGLAAAASLLLWLSVPPGPGARTPQPDDLADVSAILRREADRRLDAVPERTAATLRDSAGALTTAIESLRVLLKQTPDDADLRAMVERLERQRLELLEDTIDDIAAAEAIRAPLGKKVM
jgi:hypothetical protein